MDPNQGQDQAAEQSNPIEALMGQFSGAFEGLDDEQPSQTQSETDSTDEPEKDATDSEAETDESTSQDSDEEQPEADEEADEDEEDTEDSEEQEDDESEEEDKEPELIEDEEALVEVDGEKLSVKELKAQRMMQKDYTQKTQEVARQREELQQQQDLNAANLQWLDNQVQAALQPFEGMDWESLKQNDPAEYQAKARQYQQAQQTVNQIQQQQNQFLEQVQQQRQEQIQKQAQESVKQLKSMIPGWSDQLYGEIRQFATENLGFAPDEFNQIADHRPIYAMYKAMLQERGQGQSRDKLKAKHRTVESKKKAKASKKTSESGRKKQQASKAASRLQKSGSVDDAAAWFATQIDV